MPVSQDSSPSQSERGHQLSQRARSRRVTDGLDAGPAPGDSLGDFAPEHALRELAQLQVRRLTFVVFFRVVLITLVLGITTLLYWLADSDLATQSSLAVFAVIAVTYLLTIGYSLEIRSGHRLEQLSIVQLIADLAIASIIVHVTGGAQSAYTFFFPLAIIGAALLTGKKTTIGISVAALILFVMVATFGWLGWLPTLSGQDVLPYGITGLELTRALALNGAAIIGVSLLAVNLGSQLQQARRTVVSQSSAAADLQTLHSDIVRSLTSGLITVDMHGEVNSINRTARRILDIDAKSLVGRDLGVVMPTLGTNSPDGQYSSTATRIQRAEITVSRSTGDVVLGVSVSPLFDRNHLPIGRVVNFQDLTELREMESQVRRSERLAVIGRLAAGVAHEIRNPLASISGSVELLRSTPRDEANNEESDTLMGIITREIDRLNRLITELLDYTNPGSFSRTEFDLSGLLKDTVDAFSRDRDVDCIKLSFESPSERVRVYADSEKLRQVCWNLLRNASEAAKNGGHRVSVRISALENTARVEIEDNGPGVPKENLDRIFEPFFTTKEGGTGLGLAIVHGIIEEHGGSITTVSTLGEQTIFRFELPLHRE